MEKQPTAYRITATSAKSAIVEEMDLGLSETETTRRVLRAQLFRNTGESEIFVSATIVHQRRARKRDQWEDLGEPSLSTLKAREAAKIDLKTDQTRALFEHLKTLYGFGPEAIAPGKVVYAIAGDETIVRAESKRARVIQEILEADHGEEFWKALANAKPDLANQVALAHIHNQRQLKVEEFEANIGERKGEEYWQTLLAETAGFSATATSLAWASDASTSKLRWTTHSLLKTDALK